MATLSPPPLRSGLTQHGVLLSPDWAKWMQNLQSAVVDAAPQVFTPYTAASPLAVPTDWQAVSFTNGWVALGGGAPATQYRKDALGWVELAGEIKSGTLNTAAFTLASGYAPTGKKVVSVYSFNGSAQVLGVLVVNTDGTVVPSNGSNTEFSLDGVTFEAAGNVPYVPSCFPFNVTLPASFVPVAVIAQCAATGTPTRFTGFPVDWTAVGTTLTVNNIPGLIPSTSYLVTLLAN